jgi:hypothetical protein
MTYSVGNLISAADYNGFVSTTLGGNVNVIWGTGAGADGYGQTALSTVSAAGNITAAQWASLVNTVSNIGAHQGPTLTSRTAPVAGNTITILSNLGSDLANCYNNVGNAASAGTQYGTFTGTTSKTTGTGSGSTPWTITFTHTITWSSADAVRYFFNAGGLIRIQFGKTSTGTAADDEWNDLAGNLCGNIYISHGEGGTHLINGTSYTGTTKIGGTGTPNTLNTNVGWFDLTTSDTTLYKQFADTVPYTLDVIEVKAKTAGTGTQLVLTTTWSDTGLSGPGSDDTISGGTATSSPSTTITGTAPTTLVTYIPPSTTYLTASWGTPTIAASVT